MHTNPSLCISLLLSQVPDIAISHLYPTDDNYELHPTDPTRRCPKSLTDLCIDAICRSLPDLDGELPPGLPQDVVDRIVRSLTAHAALNSTTLRALSRCELGSLSLANCRGVSDEWFASLSSSGSLAGSPRRDRSSSFGGPYNECRASSFDCHGGYASSSLPSSPRPPPLSDVNPSQFAVPSNYSSSFLDAGSSSSMMMDLEDYDELYDGEESPSVNLTQSLAPLLPRANRDAGEGQGDNANASSEDCSRSTSSFISASSRPASPILPSVLPPPEFFSLKWSSPAPSSSLWLYPMRGVDSNPMLPTLPMAPHRSLFAGTSAANGESTTTTSGLNNDIDNVPFVAAATSTIKDLDLRGSQRLTDRGLLQLASAPLSALEVARLDNCHGITGRGLLAFSRSHRLHTLSLANCRRLTDEAVVNVSHLGASLTALNLGGCRCLTDRSLEALSGLEMLIKLDLSQV